MWKNLTYSKIKRRQESWGMEKITQHTFRNIEFIYIHRKTVSHFIHGSQKRNNTLMALDCYQRCLCGTVGKHWFSLLKDLRLRFQKVILPLIFLFKKMGKFWTKGQRVMGEEQRHPLHSQHPHLCWRHSMRLVVVVRGSSSLKCVWWHGSNKSADGRCIR